MCIFLDWVRAYIDDLSMFMIDYLDWLSMKYGEGVVVFFFFFLPFACLLLVVIV